MSCTGESRTGVIVKCHRRPQPGSSGRMALRHASQILVLLFCSCLQRVSGQSGQAPSPVPAPAPWDLPMEPEPQPNNLRGPPLVASLRVQLVERAALLALKGALQSHPAFTTPSPAGLPWGDRPPAAAPGSTTSSDPTYLPCRAGHVWAWVNCTAQQRVASLVLDSRSLNQANITWGGPPGVLPLSGHIPWHPLSALKSLSSLILSNNNISGTLQGAGKLSSLRLLWLDTNAFTGTIPAPSPSAATTSPQGLDGGRLHSSWPPPPPPSIPLDALMPVAGAGEELLSPQSAAVSGALPEGKKHQKTRPGRMALRWPEHSPTASPRSSKTRASSTQQSSSYRQTWVQRRRKAHRQGRERRFLASVPPKSPGLPHGLESLKLDSNLLRGSLPNTLSMLSNLTRLSAAQNSLQGAFPPSLGALSKLVFLDLHASGLRGSLPSQWSSLHRLTLLHLAYNRIAEPQQHSSNSSNGDVGVIPATWSQLSSLQHLILSNCSITGPYPQPLTSLSSIASISMSGNSLSGSLPASLWAPPRLKVLDISSNYFQGALPLPSAQRLQSPEFNLNPSSNCLSLGNATAYGSIPPQLLAQRTEAACNAFYNISVSAPPPAPSSQPDQQIALIIGLGVGVPLLLLLVLAVLFHKILARLCCGEVKEEGCEGKPRVRSSGSSAGSFRNATVAHADMSPTLDSADSGGAAGGVQPIGQEGEQDIPWRQSENEEDLVIQRQGAKEFSFAELERATGGFSREQFLGSGQYGEVFFGRLPTLDSSGIGSQRVAIKRPARSIVPGTGRLVSGLRDESSFRNEIRILSAAYHRNLVALKGYCWEAGELLLVYEFVSRGSLENLLHGQGGEHVQHDDHGAPGPSSYAVGRDAQERMRRGQTEEQQHQQTLSWDQRIQLAVGAARGINFLHNGAIQPILHLDIKSSNILVDDDFAAKVADFGLSRVYLDVVIDNPPQAQPPPTLTGSIAAGLQQRNSSFVSSNASSASWMSGLHGTRGYVDPECTKSSQLNAKSDVYSFGVVLLELATGWRPIEVIGNREVHIVEKVVEAVNTAGMELLMQQVFPESAGTRSVLTMSTHGTHADRDGTSEAPAGGTRPTLVLYARLVCLGLWCCCSPSKRRPGMRQVLKVLMELEQGIEGLVAGGRRIGAEAEEFRLLSNGMFRKKDFRFPVYGN